ncbi:MAG: hypothetical protein KGQ88_04770 [Chloroflexi bacterium]|nr:hypothetical protein [Chloroflexota bacterium]
MRRLRWALAALAVAAACTPLAPTATPTGSPLRAPTATSTSRAIAAVPAPAPSATGGAPLAAVGPAAPVVPTPRPALDLPIENAPCVAWPSGVETLMTQLPLPPSICLVRTTSASVDHLVCTVAGCVPVARGCADQGQCLEVVDGTSEHYVLVFIHPPAAPPAPVGEDYELTRDLCRLHQYRSFSDTVLPGEPPLAGGWLATVEAREFRAAFSAFETTYAGDARRWHPAGSDFEDYADVCAAWYYPAGRAQRVSDYLPLATFAKKWLPLPSTP